MSGRVVADESYFDARRDAPGWKPSYVGIESRPLSALSVDGARFAGANGSAAAAARMFTAALERRGISVRGAPKTGPAPHDAFALAVDYSDPLVDVVREMNQQSDNFVAEMLLKELGASVARHGTTTAGAQVVGRELRVAGVPTSRRPHRRRLGPLAARPPDARRARRHPPRRRRRTRRSATRS